MELDYNRDKLFDELGLKRLKESYMREDENSPQERFAYVSKKFSSNEEHAKRLYEYSSKHWLSYSTPILSYGKSKHSLPVSCYLSYMDDSSAGLVDTLSEVNTLSMLGGGVGIGVGIRSADDKSVGIMPHMKIYDASSMAYRQGKSRRGSYAAYLKITHPDVLMFLDMRKPTGDPNIKCLNMHHGIILTDQFMNLIEKCMIDSETDDTWNLYDDHDPLKIKDSVSAKELWQRILELRMQTGEPYILFIDTANKNNLPEFQKNMGLEIKQSNICCEVLLPTDKDRTAVCCLSSLNLRYYDEWKDNYQFYKDIAEMLDNVLTVFINDAPEAISRAKYSAMRERAVGIGALGFHTYLQQNKIPFESALAKSRNIMIFKNIRTNLDKVNQELGKERGNCPDYEEGENNKVEYKRFSKLMAIAPNASTSIIMGNISPSIEPIRANAYRQDTMSGFYLNKNPVLDTLIKEKCEENSDLNYDNIWGDIVINDGSIQHLDIFTKDEKDIFKTAMELDQRWIVELASDRQKYIDQTQSINLFFRPNVNIKYLHAVHFMAWKYEIPTLYYCRSDSLKKSDKISKQIEREIIEEINMEDIINNEVCLACEG